ncbi:MAG: hypothetical protein V5A27_00700 [Halapricum sp.]
MSNSTFTFYPTVREGYRPEDTFSKSGSDIPGGGTAQIDLELTATGPEGTTIKNPGVELTLYGPGEVTNLDTDQIVRMEPEPETTAFPPNYFPLVEFDSPQLPWLFSPQRADDKGRNRPWLCLVVVEAQNVSYKPAGTGPLPVLETPTDELPDATETWAWAHAQVVGTHSPESVFGSRSTATVSRLLCPRNLDPKTKYRACVVPTFEPGRRAGLGLDPYPDGRGSMTLAWGEEDSVRLPVYHSWVFTSAARGDFESLARELDPVEFGPNIGFRSIDVSNPGPIDLKLPFDPASDTGTVGIGGALKSTGAEPDTYDEDMRSELRDMLNTPNEVVEETDYGAVGPPLYGQWHAGVPELEDPDIDSSIYYQPHWFNTLNSDPRNRTAAGYGTLAIQDEQERLMSSAWEQFGDLDIANRFLQRIQLSESILSIRHHKLESLSTGTLLGMSAPVHGMLLDESVDAKTIHGRALESDLPTSLSSSSFRRITRSTGPLARRPGTSVDTASFATHLETGRMPRMTDGLSFSFDQPVAEGGGTAVAEAGEGAPLGAGGPGGGGMAMQPMSGSGPVEEGGEQSRPSGADESPGLFPEEGDLPEPGPDVERVLTALDGLDTHAGTADGAVTDFSTAVRRNDVETVRELAETSPTVLDHCESIRRNTFDPLSRALAKVLTEPRPERIVDSFDRAAANQHLQALHRSQRRLVESVEASMAALAAGEPPRDVRRHLDRADGALGDLQRTSEDLRGAMEARPATTMRTTQTMSMASGDEFLSGEPAQVSEIGKSTPKQVQLPPNDELRNSVINGLNPTINLSDHAIDRIGLPELRQRDDPVEEVMAAPTFTDTTYELLAELDQEYFLPGAGDIPKNSIGVLQTNPEFIESFMTGLNHEFARELQWRNFPTDRAGTYFRRFWDRKGNPDIDSSDPEQMADITPIHTWDENELGTNSPHDNHAKVVLLIRGELLRRYPNTDVFVAKAVGEDNPSTGEEPDRVPALPNTHVSRDDAGEDVKFPVFRGKLDPDITFFGFDLSPDEALYDPYHEGSTEPDDHSDEGWFFVLQEPPAETRFGMDVGQEGDSGGTPYGIGSDDAGTPREPTEELEDEVETGWSGLSWAHIVEEGDDPSSVTHVDVDGSRPGQENWSFDADDVTDTPPTRWGFNSAHMARATWQLPVRISIHADDMIPEEPPTAETDWRNVQIDTPATILNLGDSQ